MEASILTDLGNRKGKEAQGNSILMPLEKLTFMQKRYWIIFF